MGVRINRTIELLEGGQPIYYVGGHTGLAGTFHRRPKGALTGKPHPGAHLRAGPDRRRPLGRLHQRRLRARGVQRGRPRRLPARHGGRGADPQRPPHADHHRGGAGQRHRARGGGGQRLAVPAAPGARRARRHPVQGQHAGRGGGVRRGVPLPDQPSRRGHRPRHRPARRRLGGQRRPRVGCGRRYLHREGGPVAAESGRRAVPGASRSSPRRRCPTWRRSCRCRASASRRWVRATWR